MVWVSVRLKSLDSVFFSFGDFLLRPFLAAPSAKYFETRNFYVSRNGFIFQTCDDFMPQMISFEVNKALKKTSLGNLDEGNNSAS